MPINFSFGKPYLLIKGISSFSTIFLVVFYHLIHMKGRQRKFHGCSSCLSLYFWSKSWISLIFCLQSQSIAAMYSSLMESYLFSNTDQYFLFFKSIKMESLIMLSFVTPWITARSKNKNELIESLLNAAVWAALKQSSAKIKSYLEKRFL